MKKNVLMIIILFIITSIYAQSSYYYYKGDKQYLLLDKSHLFISVIDTNQVLLDTNIQTSNFKKDISDNKQIYKSYIKRYWQELTLNDNLVKQYEIVITSIKQNNSSAIVAPYYTNRENEKIGLTNFIYVKLKELADTVILKQDQFIPLWFVLSVTNNSIYNTMELAAILYESNLFQNAEPDLILDNYINCVNDTCFSEQWGLSNTGQYGGISGIDINACQAWQISTGNNTKVAVLDRGIESYHPDLIANICPQSYDTESGTSPSQLRGVHGTVCAGIIGAVKDNGIGIAGIAPSSQLMSVSAILGPVPNIKQKLANGINWSWQNGADVISNSWGNIYLQSSYIDDAITYATTQGRNKKGCVVVSISGNDNEGTILYPASLPQVIAVGAISPCGERKSPTSCDTETNWGSNYGSQLDIVAPGVLISTTDNQNGGGYNPSSPIHTNNYGTLLNQDYTNTDYTIWFNGTSAACPHVSGVAALILSVNPYLNERDVRDISEQTSQKIGPDLYTYSNNPFHPNGTWNIEMGHGLLDAYAAVLKAQELYSSTLDLYIKDRHEDLGIPGGYYWQADRDNSPDMWVRNQPDGRTNQVHESPEYNPNQPVYLYVRVRNKSCVPSVGTEQLKVFWSKAAGWSSWPEKWDGTNPTEGNIIDSVYIGEILPGRDSIYEFTWNIYNTFQNGNWHQCLLARIENSAVDTIIIAPYDNIHDDVYFNNNVSWKNVVVSNLIPNTTLNSCGGYFYVGNPTNQATVQQLKLSESSLDGESGFLNEGELFLTFDSVGWQFFYPLIANNKEIKFLGQRKIQLMKDNFNITNIVYPTNTVYPIFIEYKLVSSRSSEQKSFKFDVREYLVDTNVLLLGGVHFTINKPDFDDFLAKTEKQIKVNANSQVSLSATQYSGNYDYYWYNNNDSLIGNSASITFPAPEQSAVYQLQVLSDDFCIYDYSNITIIVNQNYINSISPNPANTNISVEYRLSNTVTVAEFIIVNQLGVVQTTQPININLDKQDIYVGRLPAGVYTRKLKVDNEISDIKTFIKV